MSPRRYCGAGAYTNVYSVDGAYPAAAPPAPGLRHGSDQGFQTDSIELHGDKNSYMSLATNSYINLNMLPFTIGK